MIKQQFLEEQIIKYLSQGFTQLEIASKLQKRGIIPASLSSVEKVCAELRRKFKAKTNFHLAVKLCRKGHI